MENFSLRVSFKFGNLSYNLMFIINSPLLTHASAGRVLHYHTARVLTTAFSPDWQPCNTGVQSPVP